MKEIKFRFWDKRVNKFRYDLLISNANQYEGLELDHVFANKVYDIYNDYGGMFSSGLVKEDVSNHVVVQQYTGLKDKNGVEIYEGDMLLWEQGWMYPEMNGEIQWVENGYHFVQPEHNVKWLMTRKSLSTAKIVGNIFEGVDK